MCNSKQAHWHVIYNYMLQALGINIVLIGHTRTPLCKVTHAEQAQLLQVVMAAFISDTINAFVTFIHTLPLWTNEVVVLYFYCPHIRKCQKL